MTLIEVVAAIMLLSALMTSVLVAFSRHRDQIEFAKQKEVAIEAADALLDHWYGLAEPIPLNQSGVCQGHPNLNWQTSITQRGTVAGIDMFFVEFTIVSSNGTRPLLTVQLIESVPVSEETL